MRFTPPRLCERAVQATSSVRDLISSQGLKEAVIAWRSLLAAIADGTYRIDMLDLVLFGVAIALGIVVAIDLRRAGPGLDLELIFQLAIGARVPEALDDALREWADAPECAPEAWLGPDISWEDWAGGSESALAAAQHGFEHTRLWVFATESEQDQARDLVTFMPSALSAEIVTVSATADPTELESLLESLLEGVQDTAMRLWSAGLGAGGVALFSALRSSPALRDRLRGVLFWECALSEHAETFTQDDFDLELNRTVPYLWLHNAPECAPLEEPKVPASGRKPVAVVSLGGLPEVASCSDAAAALQAAFLAAQRVTD